MVGVQSASDLDVERVARVLLTRGAVREAIALLRGAIARDSEEERSLWLLREVLAGRVPEQTTEGPTLTLSLVDGWLRRGMLVEALALLGGTPMGKGETGHEWATLLGELLAPMPVDAEPTLMEVHRQLLTGGASVALTLLEERSRRDPPLPAWALRRAELLRWMLIDNASAAESHPELDEAGAHSALSAAIRDAVNRRNLRGAREIALRFGEEHPYDPDPPAVATALAAVIAEIERHAEDAQTQGRTLPMFGHPAASMQLRMGNLPQACMVYRKLMDKDPSDTHSATMLEHVEAVLRAVRGEPVVHRHTLHDGDGYDLETDPLAIPITSITEIPEEMFQGRERSGAVPIAPAALTDDAFPLNIEDDEETTAQMPTAPEEAERLLAQGRLEEAEQMYRSLANAQPNNPIWLRLADEIKNRRRSPDANVVVRAIRSVE
jgi:hypothetical protein